VPVDPVIEYYNASMDHYFMSASQPDLDALDSGRIPGWARTGQRFHAWITRDVASSTGLVIPPNLLDVCRIYIPPADGDSHFYSASASECAAAQTQHPEFVPETTSAFLATLPDPQTGACPPGQTAVYRLWNGRSDSNHRFTTSIDVRNQMIANGSPILGATRPITLHYISEGYGPNGVAYCVEGGG
jgi:hypothetical protein